MAILHQLRLRDFRNYSRVDVEFHPGVNFIVGCNGQGKTNLIEAVYFLSLLRSFRTVRVRELCSWGKQGFFIGGKIGARVGDSPGTKLAVGVGTERRMQVDGSAIRRASEYINRFRCVPMIPEDIRIIRGPAKERRRFLDILFSQNDFEYMMLLMGYKRLIRTRNVMLRNSTEFGESALMAFDEQLIDVGVSLTLQRNEFMKRLGKSVSVEWGNLVDKDASELGIQYNSTILENGGDCDERQTLLDRYRTLLDAARNQDIKEGWTRVGPHRDDLIITMAGRRLSVFGSEGQCRLASLALRLGSVDFLSAELMGEKSEVVVLVDDVQGDLDRPRREKFMRRIMACDQVFVVSTDASTVVSTCGHAVFSVEQGVIKFVE